MLSDPRPTSDSERERFHELLFDSIDAIVWECDPKTFQFSFVSRQAERLLGYPASEWSQPGFWASRVHAEDREWACAFCIDATAALRNHEFEYRMFAADGRVVWLRDIVTVIVEDGEAVKLRGVMVDITERKRTEAALMEREELYRLLTENSTDLITLTDLDGHNVYANPAFQRLIGPRAGDVLDGVHPEDVGPVRQAWHYVIGGEPVLVSYRHRASDGSWKWLESWSSLVPYHGTPHLLRITRDITERKRAEQALVESHNLLDSVIEGTSDAVFVKDVNGRYLMANSATGHLHGTAPAALVGKSDVELFDAQTAAEIQLQDRQVLDSERPRIFEQTIGPPGTARTYVTSKSAFRDAHGRLRGLIGITRDITERKRLEEQLRHAQKMEAVGRLAGGVAHDFNNILTVINGYSGLIFDTLPAEDVNREPLGEIIRAGERAAKLTRQLLAFSRKQVLLPEAVDLNDALAELCTLLRPLIGEDITLELRAEPRLGLSKVDLGQFEQAIVNLAVNARDAMPLGGRLTIETHCVDVDPDVARLNGDLTAGRYACVKVRDSGEGMDDATKGRIFEPFFTTKGPGQGTGLGLAMVYGFVKQSGGHIEVDSLPGAGATFSIYLPLADDSLKVARPRQDRLGTPRGWETILLVEDESAVRTLARVVLQSSGYTVIDAEDGPRALDAAAVYGARIDLLLTDLVMPRMSGRQLAQEILATRPDLRVLFMSGYTDEAISRHIDGEHQVAFLQKPFSPTALTRTVREVLDLASRRDSR